MASKLSRFDLSEYLTDDETVAAFLTEALGSNDPREIAQALGEVAKARGGIAQLAQETGLTREALYRALSDKGNPELGTILKVVHALGVKLTASMVA